MAAPACRLVVHRCACLLAPPPSPLLSLSELALHTFFFSACRKSPFPSPSFLLSFFLSNSNGTDARFCVSPLGGGGFNSLYSFAPTCLGAFLISLRAAPSRQPDTADLFHNAIHFGNFYCVHVCARVCVCVCVCVRERGRKGEGDEETDKTLMTERSLMEAEGSLITAFKSGRGGQHTHTHTHTLSLSLSLL